MFCIEMTDSFSAGQSQSQTQHQQQHQQSKQASRTKQKEQSITEKESVEKSEEVDENAVIVEVSEATFEHLVVLSPVPVLLEFYLPRYTFYHETNVSSYSESSLFNIQYIQIDNWIVN